MDKNDFLHTDAKINTVVRWTTGGRGNGGEKKMIEFRFITINVCLFVFGIQQQGCLLHLMRNPRLAHVVVQPVSL